MRFMWTTRRVLAVLWLYDRREIELMQDLETKIRETIEATKNWLAAQDQTAIGRKQ
jgi:hypothetical protein